MTTATVLLDDRLLLAHLLGVKLALPRRAALHTTTYWYYRACRAAVAGGAGQLAGPFRSLPADEQARTIQAMLELPDDIGLPDGHALVPEMAMVSHRHPRLNVLNVEAAAWARVLSARVLLSPRAARGLLPKVLTAEDVRWDTLEPT